MFPEQGMLARPPVKALQVGGIAWYAVQYSPFRPGVLALAGAQNFGIVGNGRLTVVDGHAGGGGAPMPPGSGPAGPPGGRLVEVASYETRDAVYGVCWSEANENHVATAGGDGCVRIWDVAAGRERNPLVSLEGHQREVAHVDWGLLDRNLVVSAAWDDTVRVWDVTRPGAGAVRVLAGHTYCVYAAEWSPLHAGVVLTASGDRTARVWDLSAPGDRAVLTARAGGDHECLACDWSRYDDRVFVTAGVDRMVKVWDVRRLASPTHVLAGHSYAVRRVQCSPHRAGQVASCGYDMTARVWDLAPPPPGGEVPPPPGAPPAGGLGRVVAQHAEFCCGIDWALFAPGELTTAGWDGAVQVHAAL